MHIFIIVHGIDPGTSISNPLPTNATDTITTPHLVEFVEGPFTRAADVSQCIMHNATMPYFLGAILVLYDADGKCLRREYIHGSEDEVSTKLPTGVINRLLSGF